MDLSYLEKILRLFDESTLTELEIEEEGTQIRFSRRNDQPAAIGYAPPMQYAPAQMAAPVSAAAPSATAPAVASNQHEIKSPIVGTMYRAPSPDADPYIQVGQHIEAGQTICIVEAMKLMNEIESDVTGKVVKILVENGQPVEYGQPIAIIEKD
ncbi:MAG TPA: acetyl-CoA carboxylase biotin carboxyl carrier protein [Candidatus Kapabacteria bacterium]|nr:acetyl-CoA carboxylase biotin carboxyl carrier protein [Candidatus Kapabacteria bacterium]